MKKKKKNSLIFICDQGKSHFAIPILNYLSHYIPLYLAESKHSIIHKIRSYNKKVIWVEWARKQAVFMSNNLKNNQKLIIRLHRYEMYRKKWMRKIKWENVDCVVFVNSELEREFKKTVCNSVKTITIPNAIEINLFDLIKTNNKNSLLAYGLHFHPIKAYTKLIEMFAKIIQHNSNFTLTIAGQKPTNEFHKNHYDECKNLIDKFNLSDKVKLDKLEIGGDELKTHSNIKILLEKHNAIISYSDMESFHYAFAEGLVSGLQGFCRGWRELNPYEFWNDWCYDNEQQMIDGILKWGETSIEERQRIAKTNRKYIVDNFSTKIIAEKYKKLFEEIY